MRLFLLAFFLLIPSAQAQRFAFTPPGDSEDVIAMGFHYSTNLEWVDSDRITFLSYDDNGAVVVRAQTITAYLVYGLFDALVLGNDEAFDPDMPRGKVFGPDDAYTFVFAELLAGKTLFATPFGEFGASVDGGFIGLQKGAQYTQGGEVDLIGYLGPGLLYTARPISRLHVLGHVGYHFLTMNDAEFKGQRRLAVDLEATFALTSWFGVYGGIHSDSWSAKTLATDKTTDFSATGLALGIAFVL